MANARRPLFMGSRISRQAEGPQPLGWFDESFYASSRRYP
jgi:hypothetical protein